MHKLNQFHSEVFTSSCNNLIMYFSSQNAEDFTCRSFNYHAGKRLCTLSESNVGLSGGLERDRQWDHYERRAEAADCEGQQKCGSGKCLQREQICDGKDDCGDGWVNLY